MTVNKQIKSEFAFLVKQIREGKILIKSNQRKGVPIWKELSAVAQDQWEFRHKHIARCLLRGRTMEQIETLPKEDRENGKRSSNSPDLVLVEKYKTEFENRFLAAKNGNPLPSNEEVKDLEQAQVLLQAESQLFESKHISPADQQFLRSFNNDLAGSQKTPPKEFEGIFAKVWKRILA